MEKVIAHKLDENIQYLNEHLIEVGKKSSKIGEKIGIKNIMFLVSLLHDVGKADRNFQNYILKNTKERINHSSAGARYLFEKIIEIIKKDATEQKEYQLFFEVIEYVIMSHHGLYDIINDEGESRTEKRRNYDKEEESGDRKYFYEEDVLSYIKYLENSENINFNNCISESFNEFKLIINRIDEIIKNEKTEIINEKKTDEEIEKKYFYYHCVVRLILSILKDADISDTVNVFSEDPFIPFNENEVSKLWSLTEENIEEKYKIFEKKGEKTPLNEVRKKISETAKERGKKDKVGIYKLELPTGSGKTLTSFRYAIEQAKHQKKDRIIYITAFLSVLEQNAEEIRSIVKNDDYVLEHHSNVLEENDNFEEENFSLNKQSRYKIEDYNMKEKEKIKRQYLINGWENPIILTTMVQFYNSLFKGKASNIRRFSKLINSVVIIDEVQSIPKKSIYISNLMTNFMKYFMNCTVIHCTATQPCFDEKVLSHKVMYGDKKNKKSDIVTIEEDYKKVFERVDIHNCAGKEGTNKISTDELFDFAWEIYSGNESLLIILNTKKAVKKMYDTLKNSNKISKNNLYYLSTNMCASHRLEKIREIKLKLSENEKIICISTQLIEAGVDVDFDVVIRSMTGVDSLIQSIGRCNREGKKEKGKFFIINYLEEDFKYLREIKKASEATSGILKEKIENINNLREIYYKRYYINNCEEMKYNIKNGDNLLSILSFNKKSRSDYRKLYNRNCNYEIVQSLKTASIEFNLIENDTTPIIVNYDTMSNSLILELKESMNNHEIPNVKNILKKLQRYTVNTYDIKKFERFMEIYNEYGVYILMDNYYGETGIETDELSTLII